MTIKPQYLLLVVLVFLAGKIKAQSTSFLTTGKIEFEKRINTRPLINYELKKSDLLLIEKEQYEKYSLTQPQFRTMESILFFNDEQTLFVPALSTGNPDALSFHPTIEQRNTIFTDLVKHTTVCQKRIMEDDFLVFAQTAQIKWKITSEVREIAGYSCRRADAVIFDSIYVVAFYTDMILTEGGPESFNGLPGMILGVILPGKHVSWYATKVTVIPASFSVNDVPNSGKKINLKELSERIERLKNNGASKKLFQGFWEFLLL